MDQVRFSDPFTTTAVGDSSFFSPVQEFPGDVEPLQDEDRLSAHLAGLVAPPDGRGGRNGRLGRRGGAAGRPLRLGRGGGGGRGGGDGGAVEGLVELAEVGEDGEAVEQLGLHHVLGVCGIGTRVKNT